MRNRFVPIFVALAGLGLATASANADTLTLTDAAGVAYQVNHGITYSTSSSASGAAQEASYTAPVAASTAGGGTSMATLDDAFDGFGALAVATDPSAQTAFSTDNAAQEIYNVTGAAYTLGCDEREMTFPVVRSTLVPGLDVSRRVFVPADDSFIRWTDVLANTTDADITVYVGVYGNLGSDSNTEVFGSSSGDMTASVEDSWVGTMQAFGTGTSSSDPRLGHVMRGTTATDGVLSTVLFANGDDNPYWWYQVSVPAGEARLIVHYTTPAGSKAAASAQAEALANLTNAAAVACFTPAERLRIVNFDAVCTAGTEGAACEDGDLCTTGDTCTAGVCTSTPVTCGDGCRGVCDPGTGACEAEAPRADGTSCDDGDACTAGDACAAGECGSAGATDCDDGDVCTADACDVETGCSHTMIEECKACADDADCDDGDACNGEETCATSGTCAPGSALSCDDGDACTADSCDAATGCAHEPITTGTCAPDAGGSLDGGVGVDAGGGPSTGGGCGCSTAGTGRGPIGALSLLALGLLLLRRRRR